jgi:hypothetical protein
MNSDYCDHCGYRLECLASPICLILLQGSHGSIVTASYLRSVIKGKAFSSDRNYCTCKSKEKQFHFDVLEICWSCSSLVAEELPLEYQQYKATCLLLQCKNCMRELTLTYDICPKLGGIFKRFKKKRANCLVTNCKQMKRIPEEHVKHVLNVIKIPVKVLVKKDAS